MNDTSEMEAVSPLLLGYRMPEFGVLQTAKTGLSLCSQLQD